jgi:hypothetical protein
MADILKHQEPQLLLEPKPSKCLLRMLILVHGLGVVACLISDLPVILKSTLPALICLHFYVVARHINSVQYKVRHSDAFAWEVWEKDGFEPVRVLSSTVVTDFAVFLHIKRENATRRSIVILNDALSKDAYRALVIRLKTTVT